MITATDLQTADRIKGRILQAAGDSVERIVLHGSRAAGRARPTSDYDILVVLDDPIEDWVRESLRLSELFVDFEHPVDVQVFGMEEFEDCRPVPATIAYPADQFGTVLYARRRRSTRAGGARLDRIRTRRPGVGGSRCPR